MSVGASTSVTVAPTEPGWPRPLVEYAPRPDQIGRKAGRLPALWLLEHDDDEGTDWTTFRPEGDACHENRLCAVCGEGLHGLILLGVHQHFGRRRTSGPGCHPRCMALAAKYCPHLEKGEQAVVAWLYSGTGLGYHCIYETFGESPYQDGELAVDDSCVALTRADVKSIARRDPLGVQTPPMDSTEETR